VAALQARLGRTSFAHVWCDELTANAATDVTGSGYRPVRSGPVRSGRPSYRNHHHSHHRHRHHRHSHHYHISRVLRGSMLPFCNNWDVGLGDRRATAVCSIIPHDSGQVVHTRAPVTSALLLVIRLRLTGTYLRAQWPISNIFSEITFLLGKMCYK